MVYIKKISTRRIRRSYRFPEKYREYITTDGFLTRWMTCCICKKIRLDLKFLELIRFVITINPSKIETIPSFGRTSHSKEPYYLYTFCKNKDCLRTFILGNLF
jgi:hypothetical protein